MGTDVFDEEEELCTTMGLAAQLKGMYLEELRNPGPILDPDARRICTQIATNWPGDEVVRRIMLDTAKLMSAHDIDPGGLKW